MRNIEFIVNGKHKSLSNFYVNGKKMTLVDRPDGMRSAFAQVDGDRADCVIYKTHEYGGKLWWLFNILYYIISVFGIFDIKQDKSCSVVDCRFRLNLTQDTTKAYISICDVKEDKFAIIDTIAEIEEFSNKKYIDYIGVKRRNILKWIKIAIFLGCLIAGIAVLIAKLG